MSWREFKMKKDPDCAICGTSPTILALIDYEGFCGVPTGDDANDIPQLSATGLSERLSRGDEFLLLDVREPQEFETARIEGAVLVPLGELEARVGELSEWRDRRVVAQCHHGGRSAAACRILAEAGFTNVANLVGGIEAWSLTVDPAVPRY